MAVLPCRLFSKVHVLLVTGLLALSLQSGALAAYDARWVEVPNSTYNGRGLPAIVYDPILDRIVMYGGGMWLLGQDTQPTFYCSNQILEFKSGDWREISLWNTPSALIRPRVNANSCYDASQDRIIIAGGTAGASYQDTWSIEGDGVQKVNESFPSGNDGKALFFNTIRNSCCYVHETGRVYELKNEQWGALSHSLPDWGVGAAHYLFGFASSYDPTTGILVIFGGESNFPPPPLVLVSDTFIFDTNTNTWTKVSPVTHPSARYYSRMVYVPSRNRHILVGGEDLSGVASNQVWEFDDAALSWRQLSIENPSGRTYHQIVYDNKNSKLYSIGGYDQDSQYYTSIYELQFITPTAVKSWKQYE